MRTSGRDVASCCWQCCSSLKAWSGRSSGSVSSSTTTARGLEIDTEPHGPGFKVRNRRRTVVDQLEDELFAIALFALQFADQLRLLKDHLGGDADQFAELAHGVRLAGESDDAADLAAHGERNIDAGFYATQRARRCRVNFDGAVLRQGEQRAGMQFADARRFSAAQDDAAPVHHVDVERDDSHRPVDDVLRESCLDGAHALTSLCVCRGGYVAPLWAFAHFCTDPGAIGILQPHDDKPQRPLYHRPSVSIG